MTDDVSMAAAEFSLGTLDASARKAFTHLLAQDSDLRADVAFWNNRLAPLADMVEPVEPSRDLWSRIEKTTGDMDTGANVVTLRRQATRWRAVAMGSAALAACMTLVVSLRVSDLAGIGSPVPQKQITASLDTVPRGSIPSSGGVQTASAPRPHEVLSPAGTPSSSPVRSQNTPDQGAIQVASAPREQAGGIAAGIAQASGTRDQGGLSVGGQIIGSTALSHGNGETPVSPLSGTVPDAGYIAALTKPGESPAILVRVDRVRRTIQITTPDLSAPEGKRLQAWLLPPKAAPRALGSISNPQAWLAFPDDVNLDDAAIGVTAETDNAAVPALPAGDILYRGRLVGN